ncbi:hypothetical protein [Microbacterium indicum]|uniref:hypothetical protein n=1 Tax=Microbacterium indicum TaxID=358100 RepID=UPI0012ECAB8E|nr:hypothetical protein [Microbacterium indicum]
MVSHIESSTLLEAIAIMTDWRRVHPFVCTATVWEPEYSSPQRYRAHIDPGNSSFNAENCTDHSTLAYDDSTREMTVGDNRALRTSNMIAWEPFAVRLAFPLSLPIWGRRHDAYTIIGTDSHPDSIELHLATGPRREPTGTMRVDRARRITTSLRLPTLAIEYTDFEPARSL